jgi:4-hydroxy-3-methylbut-2-enyl diphosphate reductase
VTGLVCTPLAVERAALRRPGSSLRVIRTGMGRVRPSAGAALAGADALLVAGVCGGLAALWPGDPAVVLPSGPAAVPPGDPAAVRPGDLVVATEVRGPASTVPCPSAPALAGTLRRLGLRVHAGPVHTSDRAVAGATRRALAATGALAVDMESAALAAVAAGRPFAVVRAVVDAPGYPLWHPGTIPRGLAALRALRLAVPALAAWCAAAGTPQAVPHTWSTT